MARDRGEERRGDRIGVRLSASLAAQHIGPPLQADFTGQNFPRRFAHARHFDIERIERMQRVAMFSRRKQRSQEAVAVGLTDQLGAIGEGILHDAA